jgi:hypothetical protein
MPQHWWRNTGYYRLYMALCKDPRGALLIVLFATTTLALAGDSLNIFGYTWSVPNAADWKIENERDTPVLRLLVGREPLPGPRRPFQFAIASTPAFQTVQVEADLRPTKRSLMIVFAYHDPAHFDYAHLSTDTAQKQPVHNGVFHVYGGERVRISGDIGPAAFPAANQWYRVTLNYDGKSGEINVMVDGHAVPALHAFDVSLGAGQVGIGSFDETGDFRNVRIAGRDRTRTN